MAKKRPQLTCDHPECIKPRTSAGLCKEHNSSWYEGSYALVHMFLLEERAAARELFFAGRPVPEEMYQRAVKARAAEDRRVNQMFRKLVKF